MDAEETNLGFLVAAHPQRLRRWHFPSKVGGKPEWMETRRLPKTEDLVCQTCREIQTFLLQVYAPVDGCAEAFHRALWLFGCMRCGTTFSLFRCQMPRENPLYPSFPLAEIPSELFWTSWKEASRRSRSLAAPQAPTGAESRERDPETAAVSVHPSEIGHSAGGSGSSRGRKGEKEALVCALERLQTEERRLRELSCPVCGLPSAKGDAEEAEQEEHPAENASCMRRKLVRLLLLRNQEATSAYHKACEDEDGGSRVIDVDEEEALLEEIKHQAEQGVDRLHRRCRIFAAHWSRGLCCALPEFELEVGEEEEREEGDEGAGPSYEHEKELLKKYEEEAKSDPDAQLDASEQEAFESIHDEHSSLDPQLLRFLKRCSSRAANRGQVLRYALGGRPLWPFTPGQMEGEPPACENCGAARQFEFQVLPQFLFELKRSAGVGLESKVRWTGDADPSKTREKAKAEADEAKPGTAETPAGAGERAENGDVEGKQETSATVEEERETGGASRAEAAQAASERLHFALLCIYTCSAHCGGKPKYRGEPAGQNGDFGEGNSEDTDSAYPYVKEFVYVQPDPFFVKKEKKQQSV
uniref:Programmed cell death protein 2, c-terminal domain-containing protein n=1 Tax=Toxoplasma gondii COUG TaxID=1074873 RepID=A0A2G8XRX0_TOXGO|nr:programmed cell death protein 2, c-terminal domain-containing protein [Toxoplasma gondii COUG]